jgi:glycosyltransferase involved in cell wall biosynthesis
MSRSPLVISAYPLTAAYRDALRRNSFGKPEYTTVAELRSRGLKGLVKEAILGKARPIIVASESSHSRSLEPALLLLGTLLRGTPVSTAGPDGLPHVRHFPERLASGCRLASASADCVIARLLAWRASIGSPRSPAGLGARFESWKGQRVLYIKNTLSTGVRAGGSVGHVAGVVNALTNAGAEVRMVTTEPSPMINALVRETHPSRMEVLGLPSQANVFRMQRETVRKCLEISSDWKPDLIYQRLALGDASGAVLSRRLAVPLLTEYNGSEVWCNRNWGAGVRYARAFLSAEDAMLRASALVFTISKVLHSELLARGVSAHRAGWYPNGIDPAVYDPSRFPEEDRAALRKELGIRPDEYVVTFVGTFGDWHGADVFARAAAEGCGPGGVLESIPVRFLLIGDGKNRAKAEEIFALSAAARRCHFTGLVPQARTPAMLAASDCFVSPHVQNPDGTEFFGSPTKLFEYMAMGKPIIASRLGQIAEVLSHGRTALLVEPGDAGALAGSIASVMANQSQAAGLGRLARSEAISRFSWDAHVEVIAGCLRESLHGAEAHPAAGQ